MTETFGERVRRLREAKKTEDPAFSLRRFAQAVGVSATLMSRVENGDGLPPGAEKIKRMPELLGEDPDELLALAGKVDPELPEIIRGTPMEMADVLRTARYQGQTEDEIRGVADELRTRGRRR